jgi:hypothetical protein
MGVAEAKGIQATTVQTFNNGAFQFTFGANVDAKTRAQITADATTAVKKALHAAAVAKRSNG